MAGRVNLNLPPRLIESARAAQYANREALGGRVLADKIQAKVKARRAAALRAQPLPPDRVGGVLEERDPLKWRIWRKRRQPRGIHYSIAILDRNTEYLKGTVTGIFLDNTPAIATAVVKWVSKFEPTFSFKSNPPRTYEPYSTAQVTSVSLSDRYELGTNDGWAGGFIGPEGFLGEGNCTFYSSTPPAGVDLGNPVVATAGTYSALLNRDWENWSNKATFRFNSQNGLGEVVNIGSRDNKRFILLIPKIQGSAGIQVYPAQWPRLAGSSSAPVGVAITVARQNPLESTVAGPSDYYSLIEVATGIPWSEVESVQILNTTSAALNDELAFLAKLTDESIPYSRSFGNSYTGNPFDDQESWVYPHSITP